MDGFEADAVLTVSHGFAWLSAAEFASRRGIPLHLICHDAWPGGMRVPSLLKGRASRSFGLVYRRSTSRLCASPGMEQLYRDRYGVEGSVLYPSRGAGGPESTEPLRRIGETGRPFTVAFGGTINSPGYVRALKAMAESLIPIGGRLLIFGPIPIEQATSAGLDLPNIQIRGLLRSQEMISQFREEADVLFAPMSFSPSERESMTVGFPSKIADYTEAGLPLMIYGPDYCSAVRWARENLGVASVVDKEDIGVLQAEVRRLAGDAGLCRQLASRALAAGRRFFTLEEAQQTLYKALGADSVEAGSPKSGQIRH